MAPKKRPAKHSEDVEPRTEDNGEENGNDNGDDQPVSDARSYKPDPKPKPEDKDGGDIDVQIRKDKITITIPRDGDAPDTLNRIADLLDGM